MIFPFIETKRKEGHEANLSRRLTFYRLVKKLPPFMLHDYVPDFCTGPHPETRKPNFALPTLI
jgi:hypothetical protein